MTALYPGKEEKEKMKEEDCKKAYQLWLEHATYKQIGEILGLPLSTAFRAVQEGKARHQEKCRSCAWRKDGIDVCILPVCLYGAWKPKRRKVRK